MEEGKRLRRMLAGLTALLCLAVGLCGALHLREAELRREIAMQQQREMADVIAAMADIEVNLSKLLVASGARQSVSLLGETAILAQHVESGLSRLTAGERATGDAMKFAGQMGQYSLALAAQVSDGGMLTGADERQIEDMMRACHALGEQLAGQVRRRIEVFIVSPLNFMQRRHIALDGFLLPGQSLSGANRRLFEQRTFG